MIFEPRDLPKVELHVHLDTCISYHCAKMLMPELTLKEYNCHFIASSKCADLGEFLSKITPQLSLLQSKRALLLAVDDIFDQLHADSVIYAELRLAPLLHLNQQLTAEVVVETILKGMQEGYKVYGIEARLILCTLRHFTEYQSLETAKLVKKYLHRGVVALDLAADEARYPLDNHIRAFDFVRSYGGNCIAHAGEALDYRSVNETLTKLQVTRIGHGVKSIENKATVDKLIEQNIHLEVCPGCNIICNVYDKIEEHPVDRLLRSGVAISINTDARTIADTSLNKEYHQLNRVFGWGYEEFRLCNLNAVKACFAELELKSKLKEIIIKASKKPCK
ncbi:adenosine deaminase [Salmonella enterica]